MGPSGPQVIDNQQLTSVDVGTLSECLQTGPGIVPECQKIKIQKNKNNPCAFWGLIVPLEHES
jgi:hypothetical protein